MFTGHILALPAFYGILNILAAGLAYLFDALAGAFVYGYAGIPRLSEAAVWLSPALRLTYTLNLIYPGGNGVYVQFYGLHVVLLYALAGLILTGLALLVYRRRSLERAGDIVSVGWAPAPPWLWALSCTGCFSTVCPRTPGPCCRSSFCAARRAISWPKCCCASGFGSSGGAGRAVWSCWAA